MSSRVGVVSPPNFADFRAPAQRDHARREVAPIVRSDDQRPVVARGEVARGGVGKVMFDPMEARPRKLSSEFPVIRSVHEQSPAIRHEHDAEGH